MSSLLDRLEIKQPCSESWDEMSGNDEVRFCSHCAKHVHNLSSMTPAKVDALIRNSKGRICVRYIKRGTSQVDLPPARIQITSRRTLAAGVLAASLMLGTSLAANAPVFEDRAAAHSNPQKPDLGGDLLVISGVVEDVLGSVIPGASVYLTNQRTKLGRKTITDADGRFEFKDVELGDYELEISSIGFEKLVVKDLYLTESIELSRSVVPALEPEFFMGVVAVTEIGITLTPDSLGDLEPRSRPLTPEIRDALRQLMPVNPETKTDKKKKKKSLPKQN